MSHFFSKTRGKNNLKKKGLFWLTALGDTTRNEREGMVSGLDGSTWVHSQEAKSRFLAIFCLFSASSERPCLLSRQIRGSRDLSGDLATIFPGTGHGQKAVPGS